MSMTPEQHQRVKALFMQACEMSPAERRALLDRECVNDPLVRAEVEGLLGHDSDPHASLKTPALGLALTTVLGKAMPPSTKAIEVPDRIGPFRIERVLGVGGMGVVYLAQQDRPRRTVALKVLQPGRGASSLLKRFEHEADLLGRLRHPGIAQIFESGLAGEDSLSRPFIAMEYVDGRNLIDYALKHELPVRRRVELIIRVCEAVQHAHQRGVIHRDLKPANILVDDSGQPKVLDFGVARATDADIQLTSMNTGMGQMVGTLPYMSPEQVTGDTREIDTRSDVYALGVCLYQLLTGRLPYEPAGRSLPELARMIRDDIPARLSSIDRTLRGDLDTIVSKAMEKDKPRRYQSAAALADDLRRFLAHEPIAAKADSALYVIGKQIGKHKGPVVAAVIALIALIAFSIYASLQASENKRLASDAERARRAADARATEAEAASVRAALASTEARRAEARAEEELEFASIQLGRMAVQAGSAPAAEDLLWSAFLRNPTLPAARWGLWEYSAKFGVRAMTQAHAGVARGCTLSPDGSVVYTGGADGAVRAWSAESLELLAEAKTDHRGVYCILATPDGALVIISDNVLGLRVFDAKSLETLHTLELRDSWARCMALSHDGQTLYLGRSNGTVALVRTSDWTIVAAYPAHENPLSAIEVAQDGSLFATTDSRGHLALWSRFDMPPRRVHAHTDDTTALAFTRDARFVITGSNDERAKVWDAQNLEHVATLPAANGSIRDLDLSPDATILYSNGWWAVQAWEVGTWRLLEHRSLPATAFDLAIHPSGDIAFTTLEDGSLRSWHIAHTPEVLVLPGHVARTLAQFSPDGNRIATGDADGVLRIWDAHTGALLWKHQAHDQRIRSVAWHPTLNRVATIDNNDFTMWDLDTRQPAWPTLQAYGISHASFHISADGSLLALQGLNWTTYLFDAVTGAFIRNFAPSRTEPVSVRFTPDARGLLVVYRGPRAVVYNPDDGSILHTLPLDGRLAWTADFSADGTIMALGDWDRALTVWRTSDFSLQRVLTGHAGLLYDVAFSPTEPRVVATAGAEGTIRLWDVDQGRPLLTLDRFNGWTAHSVSFNPTGTRLLSCNTHNGQVVVFDLTHYDADIARQVEFQIRRRGPALGDALRAAEAREWANAVLSASRTSPAPQDGPAPSPAAP